MLSRRAFRLAVAVLVVGALPVLARRNADEDYLQQAQRALLKNEAERTIRLADKAIAANPKDARGYLIRGAAHEALRQHAEAVADFDRYLELRPRERPGHWRRGITLYYAGKYDEGRKQFEGYEKVDTNDVENAVWHFLCNARRVGIDKAREAMLKVGRDNRVPMMEVYDLYRGKAKPADVLAAAEGGKVLADERKQRLFYAHLYLGLYHDATGDKPKALEHMALAEGKYRVVHYMGDVAHVHADLLRKELKK